MAVFTNSPVVAALTIPLIVIVIKFPAPTGILTAVKERLFPAEAFVPQLVAFPLATQLIVKLVMEVGMVSVTLAAVASDGPRLETTMS